MGKRVSHPQYYKLNYWLKNAEGQVVDTSEGGEPMSFVEGSRKVITGLQQAVKGRAAGDRIEATIPPELAYGEHQEALINKVPLSLFDGVEQVVPGMKFQTNTGEDMQIVQVVGVSGAEVEVDANHPLAGLTLVFELEILEVRDATQEELALEKL
ncbi:MAG: peptidylprolyl isomerase [Oleiphilus sp.]|nr:MAG: peptidylprolyl isomerase [Oleiphilus sp.]